MLHLNFNALAKTFCSDLQLVQDIMSSVIFVLHCFNVVVFFNLTFVAKITEILQRTQKFVISPTYTYIFFPCTFHYMGVPYWLLISVQSMVVSLGSMNLSEHLVGDRDHVASR